MGKPLSFAKSVHSSEKRSRQVGATKTMLVLLAVWSIFLAGYVRAAAGANYIEVSDKGAVDWSNGIIEAVGVGGRPPNPVNEAQARAVAERSADISARNNLVELVRDIRIDSKTRVADYIRAWEISNEDLEAQLRKARVVDLSYAQDDEVKVTVTIKLNGALADLILPKSILPITAVEQPQTPGRKEESFTGLIVDCRGFSLQPAMVPLVADEEGEVVYGPAFVSRDHAAEKGVVCYVRGLASAQVHPRVAPRPLVVRGIQTFKDRPSDIMISNADAAKIRGVASNLSFLHQCKVVVVVD
jgi:hypothetical protein